MKSLDPHTETALLEKLIDLTKAGKLTWEETGDYHRHTCRYGALEIEFHYIFGPWIINGEKFVTSTCRLADELQRLLDPPSRGTLTFRGHRQDKAEDAIQNFLNEPT